MTRHCHDKRVVSSRSMLAGYLSMPASARQLQAVLSPFVAARAQRPPLNGLHSPPLRRPEADLFDRPQRRSFSDP
jgi:hypothetical protein